MPEQIAIPLPGCAPEPLMAYLKGIGVLRLVAEQQDPAARGSWGPSGFILTSSLNDQNLLAFFLQAYAPTPIVAPWGARTGFYDTPSERAARNALDVIRATRDTRFTQFREAVEAVRGLLSRLGMTEKPKETDKLRLLRECRAWLPETMLPWLDACYVLTTDSRAFPPLLGTGGNDGSADFTSNFMQHLRYVLIEVRDSEALLSAALFQRESGGLVEDKSPGQYHPGGIGGPNATQGFEAMALVNPWDYILMLEGTLLFAGAAARRFGPEGKGGATYPFWVRTSGTAYGSASASDEKGGVSRGEVWMPLWTRPATLPEVGHLLAEGRAQVGRRQARNGVDFARAVAGLGVDRGIAAFQRYGLLKRSGKAYLAAPLGRIAVDGSRVTVAELLLELDPWLDRFRRAASGDRVPAGCASSLRNLDRAIFAACVHGAPRHVQEVIMALGDAEATLARSPRFRGDPKNKLRPLANFSPRWLRLCDDRSPGFRLAAAFASIQGDRDGKVGPIRCHLEPVTTSRKGLDWTVADHSVAWSGREPKRDLAAVLERRILDARRESLESLPLWGPVQASLSDVHAFVEHRLDDLRLARLAVGLATLRWSDFRRAEHALEPVEELAPADLSRAYALLKLVHLPGALEWRGGRLHLILGPNSTGVRVRPEPSLARLLVAGRPAEACERAARRLCVSGFIPLGTHRGGGGMPWEVAEPRDAARIAAALIFPVKDVWALGKVVLRPPEFHAVAVAEEERK